MTELDDLVAHLRAIEATPKPQPTRAIDARLLAPAGAVWMAALVVVLGTSIIATADGRRSAALSGVGVAVIAVLGGVIGLRRRAGRSPAASIAAVTALGLAAGAGAAALHVLALNAAPVATWAAHGRQADVVAQVTSEPLRSSGPAWQGAGQQIVRMQTDAIEVDGKRVQVELPIVARLPADVAAPIGARLAVRGTMHASSSVDSALVLTARQATPIAAPGRIDAAANALRAGLVRALAPVDRAAASLVNGLAVGGTALMPALLEQDMRTVGLSHLTAVSGGNVSIALGAILLVAALLRAPLGVRIVLAMLGLAFFIVLVRPQPSVVRAAVMGAIAVIAMSTGGRRSGPSVLAVAVLVLVVLSPPLAASWGFALSVMATAGIVLLAPMIDDRLRALIDRVALRQDVPVDRSTHSLTSTVPAGRVSAAVAEWVAVRARRAPPGLTQAIALTTAAQLMTAPLIVAMGATIGWVALPANLLAAPAVAPVTILGLLAAAASVVSAPLAGALAAVASAPAAWIAWVAQWAASLPGAIAPIPTGWEGVAALGLLAALSVVITKMARMNGHQWRRSRRLPRVIAVALVIVGAIFIVAHARGRLPADWLLVACDVGQGDALLLRSAAGSTVLVDAGPEPSAVDRCLADLDVDQIDIVVLSHYDSDHIGGLAGALHGREVGAAIVSPVTDGAERVAEVQELLADTTVTPARQGMQMALEGMTMQVLWPGNLVSGSRSVQNNSSIVVLASVDGVTMLFTGDIEQPVQAQLARLVPATGVDVVKVPHHGSGNLDPALAVATHPRVAIFSVGADNDYGHPHADALASWAASGAVIARTDEQGALAVIREPDGTLALARTR